MLKVIFSRNAPQHRHSLKKSTSTDRNDQSTKPMTYHSPEQMYMPGLEPASNVYKRALCQRIKIVNVDKD